MRRHFFITGTDTGVGKTVVAALLVSHLRSQGFSVGAFKPVCSGGRGDAKLLRVALDGALTLDEINPWHFPKPIAPLLAARAEKQSVRLADVMAHARRLQKAFPLLIVEGAGGLLSPLGVDFDSLELLRALRAAPVVVASDRLGAINQVLLVLRALPARLARNAQIVLVAPKKSGSARIGNFEALQEKFPGRVHCLPWLTEAQRQPFPPVAPAVKRVLSALTEGLHLPG